MQSFMTCVNWFPELRWSIEFDLMKTKLVFYHYQDYPHFWKSVY